VPQKVYALAQVITDLPRGKPIPCDVWLSFVMATRNQPLTVLNQLDRIFRCGKRQPIWYAVVHYHVLMRKIEALDRMINEGLSACIIADRIQISLPDKTDLVYFLRLLPTASMRSDWKPVLTELESRYTPKTVTGRLHQTGKLYASRVLHRLNGNSTTAPF